MRVVYNSRTMFNIDSYSLYAIYLILLELQQTLIARTKLYFKASNVDSSMQNN